MAKYKDQTTGEIIEVGDPSLNPSLIAGKTQVADNTPLGVISTDSLAQTPQVQVPPSPALPTYSLQNISLDNILNANNQVSPNEQARSSSLKRLEELQRSLGLKPADTQIAEQNANLPEIKRQLTEASNQFRTTQAEQLALQQEQNAIPLQIQQEFAGRGVTSGGIAPIQTGRLRENAIKQLQTTSKGLFQSAIIENIRGNIAGAEAQVKRAIDLKYAPVEQEINFLKEFISLNYQDLQREDKKRADNLNLILGERERLLKDKKEDDRIKQGFIAEAVKTSSKNGIQIPQLILNRASEAESPTEALGILSPYFEDAQAKEIALEELKNKRLTNDKLQKEINALGVTGVNVANLTPQGQEILNSVKNLRFNTVEESKRIIGNVSTKLANGDVQGALADIKDFGYQKLSQSQKSDFDLYEGAMSAFDSAVSDIGVQNIKAGPYKALAEASKPYASIRKDKDYAQLRSLIELGQAQLRKGFYGTAVTGTEAGNAKNFLIVDSDPIEVIDWKLKNGSEFLKFTNDATIARSVGLPKPNLEDYLTYRVKQKSTGQVGVIPRSEYDSNLYEIVTK